MPNPLPVGYAPRSPLTSRVIVAAGRLVGEKQFPMLVSAFAEIAAAVKPAQAGLYRLIAGMTRAEKIDAGAFVYFTFLRPFALAAGVADQLDWTVPRDSLDLYEAFAMFDGVPDAAPYDPTVPYYALIP